MQIELITGSSQMKTARGIVILMFLASLMANAQTPAPVKVEQGLLQGRTENGLTVFKGIPFATPLWAIFVGARRSQHHLGTA